MRFADQKTIETSNGKLGLKKSLNFDDVYIEPQYSEVLSRSNVSTKIVLESKNSDLKLELNSPLLSANMDSITEWKMCVALWESGAVGCLHRFMTIEENVKQYYVVKSFDCECFVSVGVNKDSIDRAKELYKAGARYFIIDIAHGHSLMMKNMIQELRDLFGRDVFIMAGNVATSDAISSMNRWKVDCIKSGVGPGHVCLTKDTTGVTVPQLQVLIDCIEGNQWNMIPVVSDGGCKSIGDIAKAIGSGSTAVMSGFFFSGCEEIPDRFKTESGAIYRGMASNNAMKLIRNDSLPTPEGKEIIVERKGSVKEVVKNIVGGLKSAMSYSNARTIKEFQENIVFGLK